MFTTWWAGSAWFASKSSPRLKPPGPSHQRAAQRVWSAFAHSAPMNGWTLPMRLSWNDNHVRFKKGATWGSLHWSTETQSQDVSRRFFPDLPTFGPCAQLRTPFSSFSSRCPFEAVAHTSTGGNSWLTCVKHQHPDLPWAWGYLHNPGLALPIDNISPPLPHKGTGPSPRSQPPRCCWPCSLSAVASPALRCAPESKGSWEGEHHDDQKHETVGHEYCLVLINFSYNTWAKGKHMW